ncbi:phosphoribosyltransferase [Candidatus Laterigemmans baculatus]|uniref:phosphoribosyltransferase n=1 Tax=Candidatus Laterigemmans baculatus TaxID=2770505 RepID=UPI0013DC97B0|nr:phosphoribosyltransferase family protein [Candidatus Laterigemmans baculatus]
MFKDRVDAARQLAATIAGRELTQPLVLGIPRGGMVVAAELARRLGVECDIVLSRKIRVPHDPEVAIGAVAENGDVYFNESEAELNPLAEEWVHEEFRHELEEIARRKELFRAVRAAAPIAGRTAIVTDDGVATGATMIAALQAVAMQHPAELIAAIPVATPERLAAVRRWCDETRCLLTPQFFYAVGQFYQNFDQVTDEEVVELLRDASRRAAAASKSYGTPTTNL